MSDELSRTLQAKQMERVDSLARAKAAAAAAVACGLPVPISAASRIRKSFEEEDWWSSSILEGYWIGEQEIPDIRESIDTFFFEGCLPPEREEALGTGAPPTEEERAIHRNRFLEDVFTNPQNYENDLTFWHVFQIQEDENICFLLVASTSCGQGGGSMDAFEFFKDASAALDWLRSDGVIDADFLRWRSA